MEQQFTRRRILQLGGATAAAQAGTTATVTSYVVEEGRPGPSRA